MAWIESHETLAHHPKTKRLARMLNESIPSVIGRLHLLWWWAMSYAQDGDLSKYVNEDIADAVMWEGSPEEIVCGLISSGFLEQDDDKLSVHDWWEYAGRLVEKRKQNADRMRKKRSEHVQRTFDARTGATNQPYQPTIPNQPNRTNRTEHAHEVDSSNEVAVTTTSINDTNSSQPLEPQHDNIFTFIQGAGIRLFGVTDQQMVDAMIVDYSEAWVRQAVIEAAKNDVRKLAYVDKILKTWKQNGGIASGTHRRDGGAVPKENRTPAEDENWITGGADGWIRRPKDV